MARVFQATGGSPAKPARDFWRASRQEPLVAWLVSHWTGVLEAAAASWPGELGRIVLVLAGPEAAQKAESRASLADLLTAAPSDSATVPATSLRHLLEWTWAAGPDLRRLWADGTVREGFQTPAGIARLSALVAEGSHAGARHHLQEHQLGKTHTAPVFPASGQHRVPFDPTRYDLHAGLAVAALERYGEETWPRAVYEHQQAQTGPASLLVATSSEDGSELYLLDERAARIEEKVFGIKWSWVSPSLRQDTAILSLRDPRGRVMQTFRLMPQKGGWTSGGEGFGSRGATPWGVTSFQSHLRAALAPDNSALPPQVGLEAELIPLRWTAAGRARFNPRDHAPRFLTEEELPTLDLDTVCRLLPQGRWTTRLVDLLPLAEQFQYRDEYRVWRAQGGQKLASAQHLIVSNVLHIDISLGPLKRILALAKSVKSGTDKDTDEDAVVELGILKLKEIRPGWTGTVQVKWSRAGLFLQFRAAMARLSLPQGVQLKLHLTPGYLPARWADSSTLRCKVWAELRCPAGWATPPRLDRLDSQIQRTIEGEVRRLASGLTFALAGQLHGLVPHLRAMVRKAQQHREVLEYQHSAARRHEVQIRRKTRQFQQAVDHAAPFHGLVHLLDDDPFGGQRNARPLPLRLLALRLHQMGLPPPR